MESTRSDNGTRESLLQGLAELAPRYAVLRDIADLLDDRTTGQIVLHCHEGDVQKVGLNRVFRPGGPSLDVTETLDRGG